MCSPSHILLLMVTFEGLPTHQTATVRDYRTFWRCAAHDMHIACITASCIQHTVSQQGKCCAVHKYCTAYRIILFNVLKPNTYLIPTQQSTGRTISKQLINGTFYTRTYMYQDCVIIYFAFRQTHDHFTPTYKLQIYSVDRLIKVTTASEARKTSGKTTPHSDEAVFSATCSCYLF